MPSFTNADDLLRLLKEVLGKDGLVTGAAASLVYGTDSSHLTLGQPLAVALPATRAQVQDVFLLCARAGVPLVCRGNGTGLSGGAVPSEGCVVLGFSRLNRLGPVDKINHRIKVEPGVINDRVSLEVAPAGLHFAPDPSSQSIATIGGNIAENAGGPHCLRHGVTLQHVLGLDWINSSGESCQSGRSLPFERGFSLTALLCGSEGTLGIIQGADLSLVPNPEAVSTMLAVFPDLKDATSSVVSLLGAGLMPVAVEMVDQPMLVAIEAAFQFGFPTDVEAAMILELAGHPDEVKEDASRARELLLAGGAREVRQSADEKERQDLWKCRKKAFGAVGRLAPCYVTMDVVVPLGQLPGLVEEIQEIKKEFRVDIATAFHAGDGNLHPGVHYDNLDEDETRRAHAAADQIIKAALARGGSCTGEHGVGIEKLHVLPWQMDEQCARLHHAIKQVFDPENIFNPGKLLPSLDASFRRVKGLPQELAYQWDNMTVTVAAGVSLAEIQNQALAKGLWIPVGLPLAGDPTVGEVTAHLQAGPVLLAENHIRPSLLELWAETGDGHLFCDGAPVFKNVAGYNLGQALCGSGGAFVSFKTMTCQLRPAGEAVQMWRITGADSSAAAALQTILAVERSGPGAPVLIKDGSQYLVVVSGRRRSWDLDMWLERFQNSAPNLDINLVKDIDLAGNSQVVTMLDLPPWTRKNEVWTAVVPSTGQTPESATEFLQEVDQWIWQAEPRMFWIPALLELEKVRAVGSSWHIDAVIVDGKFSAVPAAGAGVPSGLLKELKGVFNTSGLESSEEKIHE